MHDLLFERCAHCHLFVGEQTDEGGFGHLSLGNETDEATHDAAPSGEIHTLPYWRALGPAEMRARLASLPYYDDPAAVSGT